MDREMDRLLQTVQTVQTEASKRLNTVYPKWKASKPLTVVLSSALSWFFNIGFLCSWSGDIETF